MACWRVGMALGLLILWKSSNLCDKGSLRCQCPSLRSWEAQVCPGVRRALYLYHRLWWLVENVFILALESVSISSYASKLDCCKALAIFRPVKCAHTGVGRASCLPPAARNTAVCSVDNVAQGGLNPFLIEDTFS